MKMLARLRFLPVLGLLAFGGCVAPWPALETCPEEGCAGTDSDTGTTEAMTATISTVTTDPTSSDGSTSATTGGESDSGSDATTDVSPAAEPSIESFKLSTDESDDYEDNEPLVVLANGPVYVSAEALHAEGVRLELDDGAVIDLSEEAFGVFRGELAIISAQSNGKRTAKIVPYSEDYGDGKPAFESFTVNLPEMGEEIIWTVDEYLGKGWVADVEVLENGDVLEFGTLLAEDFKRTCFLRRRNPQGAYGPGDVEILLEGDRCEAVDLAVRGDQIFVLASWTENGGRWWLGHMLTWGTSIFPYALGQPGDTATGLDLRADGGAMVCGTTPSGYGDLDAFAWVWESGEQPVMPTFDYVPDGGKFPEQPHTYDETPSACLFASEGAVMVGSAYGKHDPNDPDASFDRRFILPVDLTLGENDKPLPFVVAAGDGPGNGMQSFATAADIDDQGRLVVTGYICDLPCKDSQGHLWIHELSGTLDWFAPLGLHHYAEFAPSGVRWHPAGYAVVGSGGLGQDDAFMLRAFTIGDYDPLWTYTRSDPFQEHFPIAVTIGPYGQICAGGIGNGTYPGVACVGG